MPQLRIIVPERQNTMTACFIVRAQVADAATREGFDRWYRDEHLPDALKAFGARRAWRGWSDVDPSVHYAWYEFESMAQARAIRDPDVLGPLIAEFDRVWGSKVARSRDFVEIVQSLKA